MKNLIILFLLSFFCFNCEPGDPVEPEVPNPLLMKTLTLVPYGNHPLQNMDIHLPANRDENTKVVIMVHGGGWVTGYKPEAEVTTFSGRYGWNILTPILDEGYAVVVMKYRTVCYNTMPDLFGNNTTFYQDRMMEDIDLVIDHMKDHATEYHITNDHFQLLGESAGGHIVMTYGIRQDSDPDLVSVVSMFGPTDLDAQDFKDIVNDIPLILVTPPNYFLKQSDNCESITNAQVNLSFSIKSFSDHQTVEVNSANPFLDELSPAKAIKINRNIPLFIMHGSDDELVPVTQATSMLLAMNSKYGTNNCMENDFSCQLKKVAYDNCGHGWIGGNCTRDQIMTDIIEWINAH